VGLRRLRTTLAGSDGPGKRTLPAGEFLAPLPLLAVMLLLVNDWWLKGAGVIPGVVTGKLSDAAGLLFFPLLLTSLGDTIALGASRLGAAIDFSLRRWKLFAACLATALVFSAINLFPAAATFFEELMPIDANVVRDPTDLLALPAVVMAYWLGVIEIRRVPLGRLEATERAMARGSSAHSMLADVAICGGDHHSVDALAEAMSRKDEAEIARALETLRTRG